MFWLQVSDDGVFALVNGLPSNSIKVILLYIRYVFKISKRHLTFIKRPGHHLISLKNLISIS